MRKKTEDPKNAEPDKAPEEQAAGVDPATKDELTELREKRAQLEDQLRRAMADLQNFRKRQSREFEEVRKRTLEGLAAELLPVLDNFHLALEAHEAQHAEEADIHSMIEGLRMVQTLLHAALERHGLNEIPAAGLPFDPTLHEAVGVQPREDVDAGHVADVVQRGYQIGDKVVRPTRVVVAGPPDAERDAQAEDREGDPEEPVE